MNADQKKLKEEFEYMISAMNTPNNDGVAVGLCKHLSKEHRTIQQNFWRNIYKLAVQYQEVGYDMRNQGSVDFAKQIAELDIFLPYV